MRNKSFVLLAGMVALLAGKALADSEVESRSYKKIVGKYVFVMMLGKCESVVQKVVSMTDAELKALELNQRQERDTRQPHGYSEPCAGMDRPDHYSVSYDGKKLRISFYSGKWKITEHLRAKSGKKYPASGLYLNDGSTIPLWTVGWYADGVYLSRDGRYLVRLGPWAKRGNDLAVAFYERGRLLKEYLISDLVRQPKRLTHSTSHFRWAEEMKLDNKAKIFSISTLNGERHIIDITSGEIVRSEWSQVPNLTAEVEDISGVISSISDFGICDDCLWLERQSFSISGYPRQEGDSDKMKNDLSVIPLEQIKEIIGGHPRRNNRTIVDMRLKNGTEVSISVDFNHTTFCGETSSRETVYIPVGDARRILFK